MYQLGFVGFGKMAQAIYSGLHKAAAFTPKEICFVEKNPELASRIETETHLTSVPIETVLTQSRVLLLAIKPQNLKDVFPTPQRHSTVEVVISILAGTDIQMLQSCFPNAAIVRVMPNTPAVVGEGMSALSFSESCTNAQKEEALALFETLGKTVIVPESMMDLVTGMSGSGPAFFYQLAIYIRDYAVSEGLSESDAMLLISQTMIGAGKMLRDTSDSPETLINAVSSPNGTTVAGLEVMQKSRIQQDFVQVIKRTKARAEELRKT